MRWDSGQAVGSEIRLIGHATKNKQSSHTKCGGSRARASPQKSNYSGAPHIPPGQLFIGFFVVRNRSSLYGCCSVFVIVFACLFVLALALLFGFGLWLAFALAGSLGPEALGIWPGV